MFVVAAVGFRETAVGAHPHHGQLSCRDKEERTGLRSRKRGKVPRPESDRVLGGNVGDGNMVVVMGGEVVMVVGSVVVVAVMGGGGGGRDGWWWWWWWWVMASADQGFRQTNPHPQRRNPSESSLKMIPGGAEINDF